MADIAKRSRSEFNRRGEDLEYYLPPGGESFADCSLRVLAALEQIVSESSGDILIAGHAGVNRVILCHALGIPLANVLRIGQTYGCLNILECRGADYCVKLLNFTSPETKVSRARSALKAEPVTVI
jgi:probable phosphoglycerate mutase